MELGAGVGFTAASIAPLVKAYLCQELRDSPVGAKYPTVYGRWASRQLSAQLKSLHFDYLVMADCFYRKAEFVGLLACIADALLAKPALTVLSIHHHRNVNDSLLNFLPAFNLDATLLPWPEGISEDIDDFLARHPDLQDSFHFASLKIIKFSLKSTPNKG